MPIYLANDHYEGFLQTTYNPGDSVFALDNVPLNVPTIVVSAPGTEYEATFTVTGKTINALTGVTRIRGFNGVLVEGTVITCFNNEEFINQYNTKISEVGVPVGGITGEFLRKKSGADNDTEWAAILNLIHPVGSIYMSVLNNNPSTLFGGTWVAWGTGKVPVGVDTGDTAFNTVEKTGGSKAPALLSHTHTYSATTGNDVNMVGPITSHGDGTVASGEAWTNIENAGLIYSNSGKRRRHASGTFVHQHDFSGTTASSSNGDQTNGNLQPYITCYMWKRTA